MNTRANSEFILVCNKNETQYYDQIASTLSKYGGKEYVKYGLSAYEKYCFRKVHTFSKKEFEDFFK